jgi:hypothetical protein
MTSGASIYFRRLASGYMRGYIHVPTHGNEIFPTSIISDVLASKTGFWGH